MKKHKGKLSIVVLLAIVFLVMLHNVPKKLTKSDKASLTKIFGPELVDGEQLNFEEQIAYINRMVNILHDNYVVGVPISYRESREPESLIENGGGLCYDFSRTIEKYLINNGFATRHVAVYLDQGGFWQTITYKGAYSHSLTEVKTKNGWMIVDSNLKFYALDQSGRVYSYKDLIKLDQTPEWQLPLEGELTPFYSPNVRFVYGLYSRHGEFYTPYNFIPDYNIMEFFYNF